MAGPGRHAACNPVDAPVEAASEFAGPLTSVTVPADHWSVHTDVPAPDEAAAPRLDARLAELEWHRSLDVLNRLEQARELEEEARAAGAVLPVMRARLVVADMLHRVGDVAGGATLAVEVNAWAAERGPRWLLSRSHLVLSSVFEGIGDLASALDHAVRAIDLLAEDAPARDRGNHLLRLADTFALTGSAEAARQRYREAEAIFVAIDDVERRLNVLNNLAMLHYETGDVEAALDVVGRIRAACGPEELNPASADTIARVLLSAGDPEGAEQAVRLGMRLHAEQGDAQAVTPAELALTCCEVLLARERLDEAEAELRRCLQICDARDLAGLRVQALAVGAELHAARGDFERAYHAHRSFHAESLALRSQQDEAAARARQALFETAEARRAAQRFWQQARTDVLTDLPNRRYVDEELPRYLREAADRGAAVVAGLVDVDHFKRINDTFSHDVGDEVLRRLAGLLSSAAGAGRHDLRPALPAFAARLGGEEFLVVLVVATAAEGVHRLEVLRRRVASATWADLRPGLTVTVSVGATVARPDDTQKSLLARADGYLYRAKQTGRDRTVDDGTAADG